MSDLVYDVTEATFQAEVLERSKTVPVLVDFWADWCGPCHALAPVLERAVERHNGEVVLARVDVDQNQRLAMAFQVQGIPAVKAFAGGRLVDEFVGAQPAQVVDRFVQSLLPSEADRAAAAAAELDPAEAAARWREVLEQDPDNLAARTGLADLALREGRPAEAIELLRPVETDPEVAVPLARARLAAEAADPADPASWFAAAAAQAADGQPDPALSILLDAVREGPGETRERARELMLDVFRVLGDDHPLTGVYRKALTRALF
jgi:putative thioredoxin